MRPIRSDADRLLTEIRTLWRELATLPDTDARPTRPTRNPRYHALITAIRVRADQYRSITEPGARVPDDDDDDDDLLPR